MKKIQFIRAVIQMGFVVAFLLLINACNQKRTQEARIEPGGIRFTHSWIEALKQAKEQNKMLFVDVYTQWCGPCKKMSDEVFPLREVGAVYNKSFVCMKLDAETEEGKSLCKRYEVRSFPTYLFIDAQTEKLVHRSIGRQNSSKFIKSAQNALDPATQSIRLTEEYEKGNREESFLKQYLPYLSSIGKKKEATCIAKETFYKDGNDWMSDFSWYLMKEYVNGLHSEATQYLIQHREAYNQKFGKEKVDQFIDREFSGAGGGIVYAGIYRPEEFKEMDYRHFLKELDSIEFPRKDLLKERLACIYFLGQKNYTKASHLVEQILQNTDYSIDDKCGFVWGIVNLSLYNIDDPHWLKSSLEYGQYLAYNYPDRKQLTVHRNYARLFEKYLRTIPEGRQLLPKAIWEEPRFGSKEYSMRPPGLKAKPRKK